MNVIADYEERVYAGVLGKVCGVYAGRPFEGAASAALLARLGEVGHYVHEVLGKPLIVADDDISGTLTFVRALEDSGKYAQTAPEFYGWTWLNYLIPGRTVLWWGGLGNSTEHTAYLRLASGIRSPESGSMALNGRTVAEQIGGQIFIDGFGLVAPGDPALAARLARNAAGVSHDGEAVHAAVVVAAMVAAAFVERDMDRLLDIGAARIPADSAIAKLHRDVREWCRKERDWRKVFARIRERYGYRDFAGGCHVIPNHALMVMAWSLAGDDFFHAQRIINSAGWDTDCNAGNVGAVMGVRLGVAGINARYDYQSPMADRVLCPTAEGTSCVTDCLREALRIAAIGRRVMGWPGLPPPKDGALFHFCLAGARHGFMPEEDDSARRGDVRLDRVEQGGGALACRFRVSAERPARFSTPLLGRGQGDAPYQTCGTPLLYPGQIVRIAGHCAEVGAPANLRCFVRSYEQRGRAGGGINPTWEFVPDRLAFVEAIALEAGRHFALEFTLPQNDGLPLADLGMEISSRVSSEGSLLVDRISVGGGPRFTVHSQPQRSSMPGWISSCDAISGSFADEPDERFGIVRNSGRGLAVIGNRYWTNYRFTAEVCPHMAEAWGLVVRYQGLERYIAVMGDGRELRLARHWYGRDEELAKTSLAWELGAPHRLAIACRNERIEVSLDGEHILEGRAGGMADGGAGLLTVSGHTRFRSVSVDGVGLS